MRRVLILLTLATPLAADPVFVEQRGLVVMEAESTGSGLGRWKLKTFLDGYKGTGHLEFTGNKPENGPPHSPLRYEFRISKPGKYSLVLRAHKRLETKRTDISNDCYVAMKGDFEAGGRAPYKILKEDTKLFGGHAATWGWATTLDANHKKFPAEYILKAGETYQLTISGRSQNFNIDRIYLVHEDEDVKEVQRRHPPESGRDGGAAGGLPPKREVRTLTDQNGRRIRAELVEVNGNLLVAYVKGKRYEIEISTLSAEDREFLAEWGKK